MALPLEGVKILDLSTMLPGPFCSMILADFGAEVIKVEAVKGGDLFRGGVPKIGDTGGAFFQVNRNKKSITLNLKSDEGKEIFYKLAKDADVVLEQYRPGVVKKLGVDYETIKAINPKIVYCSLSGYGQTGPYRLTSGHDLNYISYAGILGLTARKGQTPTIPGVQIADIGGGGRTVGGDRHPHRSHGREAQRCRPVCRYIDARRRCLVAACACKRLFRKGRVSQGG